MGSNEKNGKTQPKNREIRDPYPTPGFYQDFDLGGVGWTQECYKISIPV